MIRTQLVVTTGTNLCAQVSYSVKKDHVDDSNSILAEIKGEDIDISSDSDNDEDELEILSTFAFAFLKEEKRRVNRKKESL